MTCSFHRLEKRDVESGLSYLFKGPLHDFATDLPTPEFGTDAHARKLHDRESPTICSNDAGQKGGVPDESLVLPRENAVLLLIVHGLNRFQDTLLRPFRIGPSFVKQTGHFS